MDDITGRLDNDTSFRPRLSDIDHEFKIAPLACHIGNLKAAAKRRLPRGIFDFIEVAPTTKRRCRRTSPTSAHYVFGSTFWHHTLA